MQTRKRISIIGGVVAAGLLVGGGFALAAQSSSQPDDWAAVYVCVEPNGEPQYFQFNEGASCAPGLEQWHWPSSTRVAAVEARAVENTAALEGVDRQPGVDGYYATGWTYDRSTVPAGETVMIETFCDAEDWLPGQPHRYALGGGVKTIAGDVVLKGSYPSSIEQGRASGWTVQVTNTADTEATVQPFVTCATTG